MSPFRDRLRGWLIRRLPVERESRLRQRRIYLLPTAMGWLLLLAALAAWVGAVNYQVSLAYALAFWIVGLALAAVLAAYRQLAGLRVEAAAGPAVFAGGAARFDLRLSNPGAAARRLRLGLLGVDAEPRGCELPGFASLTLSLAVPAARRGWLALPPCRLYSEAPFGLVRAWAVVRLSARTLVYPQPLADGRGGRFLPGASPGAGPSAGSDDFSHLDVYQPGDSPRQIAWKVLASREQLSSKRFAGPDGTSVELLDWHDYDQLAEQELRLSRLAWRVERCERLRQPYCLRLPGGSVGPQPRQRELALTALALFGSGR
nr:DUF58 domain-containing protein [Chromobacterium sp. ASV5]